MLVQMTSSLCSCARSGTSKWVISGLNHLCVPSKKKKKLPVCRLCSHKGDQKHFCPRKEPYLCSTTEIKQRTSLFIIRWMTDSRVDQWHHNAGSLKEWAMEQRRGRCPFDFLSNTRGNVNDILPEKLRRHKDRNINDSPSRWSLASQQTAR